MSDRLKTIYHENREILFVDYSNLKGEDYSELADLFLIKFKELVSAGKKDILVLADATHSVTGPEQYKKQIRNAKEIKANATALASVGIEGLKRFFMDVGRKINPNMRSFDTIEEAKEWLVKQ